MLRYSDEIIDEVRMKNDIIEIISQYVVLKRSGRNYFGLCPFHQEKSPSFSVSPDKQIFHCFGCGAGGNVFHFVSKIENINFKESVEELADRAGITLPVLDTNIDTKKQILKTKVYEINKIAAEFYHENLYKPSSKMAQEYIKKRRLDNQTLKAFLIGYSGNYNELYVLLKEKGYTEEEILASTLVIKNENGTYVDRFRKRLMFPIQDIRNRFIAFGGRVLDDSKPKYINSPETIVYTKGRNLFGLNVAKNHDLKKIIIVEGYMDAISLYQRGVNNVVASLGTALTEAQGRLLKNYSQQVIIGYDSDGAGQAATLRGLEILQNLGCDIRILQIEGAKDPDEFIIKYGSDRFKWYVEKAISLIEFKIKILKQGLNLENVNDKIKFLNEIARVLAKVGSELEKEVYVDKIALEYNISKEAIYAQIHKLLYANQPGTKLLEKNTNVRIRQPKQEKIEEGSYKREKMLLALLMNEPEKCYRRIRDMVPSSCIKSEKNRKIIETLYKNFEEGKDIEHLLDWFDEEEIVEYLTGIMAEDFEISDTEKCLQELEIAYKKEKLMQEKKEIIDKLDDKNLSKEEEEHFIRQLNEKIMELAKLK